MENVLVVSQEGLFQRWLKTCAFLAREHLMGKPINFAAFTDCVLLQIN
ncbi:MAG: hypothetical protein F6K17_00770 [Okeania sp. SIO3C4]|nr:hypothetical protein [Okeania sp. SIO3C4]